MNNRDIEPGRRTAAPIVVPVSEPTGEAPEAHSVPPPFPVAADMPPEAATTARRPVHMPRMSLTSIKAGFHALQVRNYRLFWFGQLISLTGTWMQRTAQDWLVVQLTHSPFDLGLVTACQ